MPKALASHVQARSQPQSQDSVTRPPLWKSWSIGPAMSGTVLGWPSAPGTGSNTLPWVARMGSASCLVHTPRYSKSAWKHGAGVPGQGWSKALSKPRSPPPRTGGGSGGLGGGGGPTKVGAGPGGCMTGAMTGAATGGGGAFGPRKGTGWA